MGRSLSHRDISCFPFYRTKRRWQVVEKHPFYKVSLDRPPQSDLFSELVFQEHGDSDLSCDAVTVCLNPDHVENGWLKLLAEMTPNGVTTEIQAPMMVSKQIGPGSRWTVYDPPPREVIEFTRQDVRDIVMDAPPPPKDKRAWHGLQRVLMELGPPTVTFDLLASKTFAPRDREMLLNDSRRLLRLMSNPFRWQTQTDKEFALSIAERNQPMLDRVASFALRSRHNEMLRKLTFDLKRWAPKVIPQAEVLPWEK